MRSTFKILFFLKRDKQKPNGMIPLFCRITVDGKEARFGMKCDVNPKYWDIEAGKATGRTSDAVKINALVENTIAAIHKVYRELQVRDNYVTAEKIKNVFLGIETKRQTLLELFDSHNRERTELIGINVTKSTCQKYYITRKLVADFMLYKYNLRDIPIKEINHQFISDFDAYLLSKCNYSKNNVITVLQKLRHIIEVALSKEWIIRNPFKGYKMTWEKVDRGYLTQSELEKLIDSQFDEERLNRARDIFIFCAFTGLAFIDVKQLTKNHIRSSIEGDLWIRGKRKKTGTDFNIPILNIPKMILEKYKGKTEGDFVLPVFSSNTHYNLLLKKMAKLCGITKNVSSHLARHTFATLTLTKGVSIESVSKMLGHTNINTTQIYARITDKKVCNEMGVFAGNVKMLDIRMQFTTGQQELTLDEVLKSMKISTGKSSEFIWENLTVKVWDKLSSIEKQVFVSELENNEKQPNSLRDFYVLLIDYFLEGINGNDDLPESTDMNTNTAFAVNF